MDSEPFVFGVVPKVATPAPLSVAVPTVTPPIAKDMVPVGTTPACVPTEADIVTDWPIVMLLCESPSVTTGIFFAPGLTVSEDGLEFPAL
jgi:hypothetical protein